MAVKIRLKRMGSKKKPFYRIIATDSRNRRDGRFIETLGYYDPLTDPPDIQVDEESIFKWLRKGAIPSESTESILRRIGLMEKWQLLKQGTKQEDLEKELESIRIRTSATPASPKQAPIQDKEDEASSTDTSETDKTSEASNSEMGG